MTIPRLRPQDTELGPWAERAFRAMGCALRVVVWGDPTTGVETLQARAADAERLVHACDARLTRFSHGSELRRLNADRRDSVVVSPLLARAVHLARRTAGESAGLLDPTLLGPLAAAGYADDWDPSRRIELRALLAEAPAREAAAPSRDALWSQITVDLDSCVVHRPVDLELDLGATAKGLVADLALRRLGPAPRAFVDAGGDLAIGRGSMRVLAEDPFGREPIVISVLGPAGVATSSIAGRCWMGADGPAHHLLDPSTGRPAFTGVVQVTACAPSAAQAERLAGEALLSGPGRAHELLAEHGGLLVLDDGRTHEISGGLLA